MDPQAWKIVALLVRQWDLISGVLAKLNQVATVRPSDGYRVFSARQDKESELVNIDFGPVVFNLPEKATHAIPNLFVVLDGKLGIRRDVFDAEKQLVTDTFATRAAYFRQKTKDCVEHVWGTHYDFALDTFGHPVFHSQLRSYGELSSVASEQYGMSGELVDLVKGMLQGVRVPTAQMDVFSVALQLCADHLLFADSGESERSAFNDLARIAIIRGAGYRVGRLATKAAWSCYRSRHWYPANG